jgi:hypothetical protein
MSKQWRVGVVAAGAAMSVLALCGGAVAGGKGPVKKSDVQADLVPPAGADPSEAEGDARQMSWKRGDVLDHADLKLKVSLPIGTAGLTTDNAAAADVKVVLDQGGVVYAECHLKFDGVEQEADEEEAEAAKAEYKAIVFLRTRKGGYQLQEVKGTCDVDTTDAVLAGMPSIAVGDHATVSVDTGGGPTDVLEGTFVAKKKK